MAEPSVKPSSILPPLLETFPAETYPLREMGTGFTAQAVQGEAANACTVAAAQMLSESRTIMLSTGSSEGGAYSMVDGDEEPFVVPELPLPEGAAKDGILILRNERLFPGMVGISSPLQGLLWVREDGTFNCSGFFRRQIPKFETAALIASTANMDEFLDVYHALYRSVVEAAASRHQFKVFRTILEAGLRHYKDESSARTALTELRRRVMQLRAQAQGSRTPQQCPENATETQRRSSASSTDGAIDNGGTGSEIVDESTLFRSQQLTSGEMSDGGDVLDGSLKRVGSGTDLPRAVTDSSDRPSKIAQQVVTGAPKQKAPFRLWKNDTGSESYEKARPS